VIALKLGAQPEAGPALAALLKRAQPCADVLPWPQAGAAALAALALELDPGTRYWLKLTPVLMRADMHSLRLLACRQDADQSRSDALFALLKPLVEDAGFALYAQNNTLLAAHPPPFDFVGADPESALGADVHDFLPKGRELKALRALQTSIEIALNASKLDVNGVWLSGGGRLSDAGLCPYERVLSADPALRGWALRDGKTELSIDQLIIDGRPALFDLRAIHPLSPIDAALFQPLRQALRWFRVRRVLIATGWDETVSINSLQAWR